MINHTELRCGNLHEYYIEDKHDERKAWWEISVIDPDDIKYLQKHPEDNFYRFIPLSEEWLIRAGFEPEYGEFYQLQIDGWVRISISINDWSYGISQDKDANVACPPVAIKFVHQLQNLYFALTGEELTFKDL